MLNLANRSILCYNQIKKVNDMKIYFIRHGHPDYKNNCLTELGKIQASACAERLKNSNIERIFSSTMGRASQTAEFTAKLFELEVTQYDFIREIGWTSIDGEPIIANGHPWLCADHLVSEGRPVADKDWRSIDPFCRSKVIDSVKTVSDGIDSWLSELGYQRDGEYYRVLEKEPYKTVAMFSHAGSSTAAMSHMLNIPFPQLCEILDVDFTSITIIELSGEVGSLVSPKIRILNDAKHIVNISSENFYGN